jgi:hypothetical protein
MKYPLVGPKDIKYLNDLLRRHFIFVVASLTTDAVMEDYLRAVEEEVLNGMLPTDEPPKGLLNNDLLY